MAPPDQDQPLRRPVEHTSRVSVFGLRFSNRMRPTMIRTITATEYVMPLREGGSLPAIIEGDDDGTYVLKFRGAGQGVKALIAELVAGEIGRQLGLRVPE